MATMFGADATALQGPQGAGTQPINPVKGVAMVNPLDGLMQAAGGIISQIGKGKETPGWEAIINQYTTEFAKASQEALTAPDSASQILSANKTRSLFAQAAAKGGAMGYGSDFVKALGATRTALMGGTGGEEGEDVRKAEIDRVEAGFNQLTAQGLLPSGMDRSNISPALRDQIVALTNSTNEVKRLSEDSEKRLAAQRQLLKDGQDNTKFDQGQMEWAESRKAQEVQGELITSGVGVLAESFKAMQARLKADGSNYAEISAEFAQMGALWKAQGSTILQKNSAALGNFNTFMDENIKLMMAGLDPKNQSADTKAAIENLVNASKFTLLANSNKLTKVVGFSSLLGHSIGGQIAGHNVSMQFMNENLIDSEKTGVNPAVTSGDIPGQRAMFGQIEGKLAMVKSLPTEMGDKVVNDAYKQYNATQNALSTMDTSKPSSMSYIVGHIANTGATFIERGMYDAEAAKKAIPVLERTYLNGLATTLKGALNTPVGDVTYADGKPSAELAPTLMNTIKFTVATDGTIRAEESRDPRMKFVASPQHVASRVRDADVLAQELTRTVKAAAHLTNTTDYKAFWEEHRHRLVKGFYPTPKEAEFLKSKGWDGVGFINNAASYDKSKGGLDGLVKESDE